MVSSILVDAALVAPLSLSFGRSRPAHASLHGEAAPEREFFRTVKGKTPDRSGHRPARRRTDLVQYCLAAAATAALDPPSIMTSARTRVWTDFAIVLVVALGCGWIAAHFELIEWLFTHSRPWERFQVDELAIVLVALALGMTWFALRRYGDARREVAMRVEAQARLTESLAEQRRLAQRYVLLQEAERKALARELHDELGQYLNAIKLDAVTLRDEAPALAARQQNAGSIIANADHVYRTVGDLIRRLRPVGLDELGLAAALEHIVDAARTRAPSTRFRLAIDGDLDRLGESCDLTIYRLVQEGLTNCARHASASDVEVQLARAQTSGSEYITVCMTDNGAGADWASQPRGLGLVGMRERVEALGGELHITTAPGYGFRFVASFPLRSQAP
jgi:two-component system, NarL family, sensor histidine kinase UhpB